MKITEAIGMISTGALIAIGAIALMDRTGTPDAASPVVVASATPVPVQTQAPVTPRAEQVTRAASTDLTSLGSADRAARLQEIVALSQGGLRRTAKLTPEQEEAISFFERLARQHNQADRDDSGGALRFSNMAVDQLTVKYFFRLGANYASLRTPALKDILDRHMSEMLCGSEAVRTLMDEYDFSYEYFYTASDHRLLYHSSAADGFCS